MRLFPAIAGLLLVLSAPAMAGDAAGGTGVVAPVTTAPAALRDFVMTVAGFGKVQAPPDGAVAVTASHAGFVSRLYVRAGQGVVRGASLFDLAATPAAGLAYQQARNAAELARGALRHTQRLFAEHLATNADLDRARAASADAGAALAAERRSGSNRASETVTAPFAGTVTALSAGEGTQMPQGAPVLTLARGNALAVRLGVEPEDVAGIQPGMAVTLVPTFDANAATRGRVRTVSGLIDPETRLVDVVVGLEGGQSPPLIGTVMRGEIILGRQRALAVPRGAVLADRHGSYVYTVKDGHAHRVTVTPGLVNDGIVAVAGDLKAGDPMVVEGNYELGDGMAVEVVGRDGR